MKWKIEKNDREKWRKKLSKERCEMGRVEKIKDHIKEKKGMAGKNDKKFLNGVFWILRIGALWRVYV